VLIGAAIAAAATIGVGVFKYYSSDKPSLQAAEKTASDAEAARQRADQRANEQQQQLATLQSQAAQLKKQFEDAKGLFIVRVTDAVNNGVARIPGAEPNRPVPQDVVNRTTIQRARQIVDERDKARIGIRQVTSNLDKVYDELDSDIDDLKKLIDVQPQDVRAIQPLLQKIANKWPEKLKLLEQLALTSLQQIGCPIQVARTP
jgi:hypothetical protein